MKLLISLFQESRWILAAAFASSIVSGAGSTALLVLLNSVLITKSIEPGRTFFLGFLGACFVIPLTGLLAMYLLERLGQGTILRLRLQFSRQILDSPLRQLEDIGIPRLLTVLTGDINVISETIMVVPGLAVNGTLVVGCMSYLAWLAPRLFLVLLALFALGVFTYRLPLAAGMRRFQRARKTQESLFKHFRGLTEGLKELKLHNPRREAFLRDLEKTADVERKLRISARMIYGTAAAWGHLLLFVVVGGLLLAQTAMDSILDQTLASYTLVLIYMLAPMQAFLDWMPRLGRANAAVERIEQLGLSLRVKEEDRGAPQPTERLEGWQELRLRGVRLEYSGQGELDQFALGPIDLTLRPGETVFVTGGNGSGKTTLAKLLVGLYSPDQGEVLFAGRPVSDEGREAYRQNFSAVFSDFYLFDRLLGLESDGMEERSRFYLRKLQLDHKVQIRHGVLSTTSLSQGQRKRLALLTAYLENRPIYLFDEWAADQDPVFKRLFYYSLLPELKERGKMVITISHDDQYYGVADRIIKLDYGRVCFDGTPGEAGIGG
ncbi:MAG: cyclic peptide export ABC transporter [Acidobacteriota bacterium]